MTRKRFIKLLMGKFLLTVVKNGKEEYGYNGCGYDGFCNYGEQREPK